MRTARLEDMTGGWYVGDFEPMVMRTKEVEVAIKHYASGDHEPRHVHRVAAEITTIVRGVVAMNGVGYAAGDIIVIEPGDETDFTALTDAVTVCVKLPSVKGDKYVLED